VAALAAAVPVAVGALVVRQRKGIGWLLIADGVSFWLILGGPGLSGRSGLVVDQLASGAWVFLFVWVALIAYLLPDGSPGSGRWRRWLRITVPGIPIFLIGSAGDSQGFRDAHHGAEPPLTWLPQAISGLLGVIGLVSTVLLLLGGAFAVLWRLARAEGDDRLRLLWLVWGALSVPVGLLGAWVSHFGLHDNAFATDVALALAAAGMPVTVGIAVLRLRLFDIQLVLSRTLIFATLTLVLAGVYIGLLWAADRAFGDGTIGGAAAVVVVAVVSAPLYNLVRRRIERWVYGYRSDPAQALRRLGASVDSVDPLHLVDAITASVAEALKLDEVWIEQLPGVGEPDPGLVRAPLVHNGEHFGNLLVRVPPSRTLGSRDLALLEDLARHAAVTVRAAQLAAELQASRSRIVAAREEERKRLRRDLHDGLGPALAAIGLKVDAARSRADERERNQILAEIGGETKSAITEVRRLVDDLRPPAIDEVGLVGAIRQRAASLSSDSLRFSVAGPDQPVLPAAVEVAAFRIASEAMANVAKHSRAHRCTVSIGIGDCLELIVADDGVGGARPTGTGVGWTSMTERAAEVGGSCTISDRPEGGLILRAVMPVATDVVREVWA
jgi:signal transduction histidine kinase